MRAIFFLYCSFCRFHQILVVTPATEAGLADHLWSIKEVVDLLERRPIFDELYRAALDEGDQKGKMGAFFPGLYHTAGKSILYHDDSVQ